MRRVTLEQLLAEAGVESYTEQYRYIRRLLEEGRIRPVKQSPRNGRTPALHLAYWQEEEETDERSSSTSLITVCPRRLVRTITAGVRRFTGRKRRGCVS